jgi:acyl-CoA synthetase (AMP-forming)/AMP-acid ligase II
MEALPRIALDGSAVGRSLENWLACAGMTPTAVRIAPEAAFNIIYSSGTTGVPKCIVHGAGGTLLQRLSYAAGQFSSTGGSYGQSPSGTATFELAAGIYEFSSSYTAVSMPATSSVEFNWGVIPAPGAAAFAVAGLIGRRRRA